MSPNLPAAEPVSESQGGKFRRAELVWSLTRLAEIFDAWDAPLHTGAYAPVIEFHVASTQDVNRVAASLGRFPTQFKDEYFVDLDNAELRVRWTAAVAAETDPIGLAYTRADDDTADPTPTGPREPLHTGGMTEGGLVDETGGYWRPTGRAV